MGVYSTFLEQITTKTKLALKLVSPGESILLGWDMAGWHPHSHPPVDANPGSGHRADLGGWLGTTEAVSQGDGPHQW